MLLLLENSFVYHPCTAAQDWQGPPHEGVRDVHLTAADGTAIHAWWCPREGADGALLYCHGNAGNLSHRGPNILALQKELGVSVLIFDYPGYGKSEGRPSEAGCYAAADAGYDWLVKEAKVPPERIILYGSSLGSGVATELASRHKHRALILMSAFTSAPDVGHDIYPWLPTRLLMRNRFDNLAKLKKCCGPVIVCHGTADVIIGYHHGERLFAAANEPKLFHRIEGGHHDEALPEAFFREARQFLEKIEAGPASR
jgi:fermentation-respiration switch protein FrsA (DUF1100 family)